VPKTLLAVDDSATMRKALEITFAGDDFRVVGADSAAGALALMREEPVAVLIDTALGADDGYALAKAVRSRDPRVTIVLMASRYNPYDAGRGKDAGADDFVDKPFDTQGLIDKVKKAMLAREGAPRSVGPSPGVHAPAPAAPAASHVAPPPPGFGRSPAPPVVAPTPAPASVKPWPAQRTHTLSFEGGVPAPPPQAAPPPSRGPSPPLPLVTKAPVPPQPQAPSPFAQPAPRPEHTAATAAPPRAPEAAIAAATNGQLASKLGALGLNSQQVEAVLALSREVVERVVWEVVPQLAEAIIKEEITRLTKEG